MKKLFILGAFLLSMNCLNAQTSTTYEEANNPIATNTSLWVKINAPQVSWGSTDIRYKKEEPALISRLKKDINLTAWKGERVSAQLVVWTPEALNNLSFIVSDLTSGKETIAKDNILTGFAPQMAIVFLFLSILEDCGYMARVAFIMDRIFRKFGLSGKSFISFLIGSGCGVPGIMSTRTIENEKDRRMTMITTTNIPCGAKLPVIALIAGFLMGGAWWMAPAMYFLGVFVVIISCIILKKTKYFAGEPAPFVMELPQYHIPSVKGVLLHVWERVWAFLKKAGTILFLCCAVMWFLGSFGIQDGVFGLVDTDYCFLATIGGAIAWIFKPLGFGTWQAVASCLSGFVAKEGIVSTMGVLAGLGEVEEYTVEMHDKFAAFFPTGIAAVSFLVFNLFDSPCLAAISTMAKEMGSRKYFWFALLFQNVTAYCAALMIYQIGGLLVGEVAFGIGTVAAFIVLAGVLYLLFRKDPSKKVSGVKQAA